MSGVLSVEVIVLAALAAIAPVRCGDLQDLDAGPLQVTEQPRAVGAGRLDANTPKRAEGAHPGEHLLVAVPGRREALACEDAVTLIDDGRDVQILVGVDAAGDERAGDGFRDLHGSS